MGDKNAVAQTEGSCDLIVKVGHGILKSIYTSTTGDRTWIIRDGISVCPATATVTVCTPLANQFSCAAITLMCALEELTACGTITAALALEQVAACATVTVVCCACSLVGEVHALSTITVASPTLQGVACGTITLVAVAVATTVNVNGLVYTAVCGTKADHTEFDMSGTDAVDATDLLDSLNNDTRCIPACDCACGITTAICSNVITVTSVLAMCSANCITLTSSCNCDIAISACGFTSGKDDDTVTVNGLVYTGVCGAKMCDSEFNICGADCVIATDLADSICMDARACACLVFAGSCAAIVTNTATTAGTAGNAFTLATNAGCRLAVGGATFCCGVNGDFVTVNGLVYTATVGAKADDTEFSIDTSVCLAATDLADSIDDDVRVGTLFNLTSTAAGAIVTSVVACVCAGTCGNNLTQTSSDAVSLVVEACFTGGNTADTVTVNGLIYTAVEGVGCTCCMEFSTDTSNCATATDLATRINCDATAGTIPCIDVTATACAAVVTVVSDESGANSNAVTLTTTDAATLAVSGCGTLTGGNDACTVTINSLIYTAVTGCGCTACGFFSNDTSNCATAIDLTTRITCDARVGTTGDQTATSCMAIVTVTTDVCGVAGDAITIVSACMCTINVGCGFEGGRDADLLTVNGLVYTAACANCACMGEWDTTCMSATNLATVLACDGRTPVTVPTHDIATAVNTCCVVLITMDPGEAGSCVCLSSNDAVNLTVSGTFFTGGAGREVIEIALVGVTSGEISMPYFNHPMRDGIFVDYISGCTGRLTFVYE